MGISNHSEFVSQIVEKVDRILFPAQRTISVKAEEIDFRFHFDAKEMRFLLQKKSDFNKQFEPDYSNLQNNGWE